MKNHGSGPDVPVLAGLIKIKRLPVWSLAALLGAALVAGCVMWPESGEPFAVTGSALNWTEVYYTTTNTAAAVRLSLVGSGHIVLARGTGSRLLNPFATDVDSANWDDYERDEINLPRTDAQRIFQLLVNRGALKSSKKLPPGATTVAQLHGRVDDKVFSCVTSDPKLLEVIEAIIALFPPPSKAATPAPRP